MIKLQISHRATKSLTAATPASLSNMNDDDARKSRLCHPTAMRECFSYGIAIAPSSNYPQKNQQIDVRLVMFGVNS